MSLDLQSLLLLHSSLGTSLGESMLQLQQLQPMLQLGGGLEAQLQQLQQLQQAQQQLQAAQQQATAQQASAAGSSGSGSEKRKRQNTRWTRDMEDGLHNFMQAARQISAQMPELELCQILVSCHGMYPKLGAVTNKWSKVKKGLFSPPTKRSTAVDLARLQITSAEMQAALAMVQQRNAEKMRKKQEQEANGMSGGMGVGLGVGMGMPS